MSSAGKQDWRAEFPSASHLVHMDHAGLAPMSRRVGDAITAFVRGAQSFTAPETAQWQIDIERARAAAARLIDVDATEVAFVRNTSEGLSLFAASLEWREGDNVVAVDGDYPSNIYPWFGLRRFGVETRLVASASCFCVDDIASRVDERTRVVAVSAVDWRVGFRADLAALGEFCRQHRILLCVDAIQALGALRVAARGAGVHVLVAGGHKWLLAPDGCGVLFVDHEIVGDLRPPLLGWNSVVDAESYLPYRFELRPDARRFEAGSPPTLGIVALGAALELIHEVGAAEIEALVRAHTDRLCEELRRRDAEILSPRGIREWSSIVTFRCAGVASLAAALAKAGIVAKERAGGIRLAPHFYASDDDLERVLAVVDRHGSSS